MACWLHGLVERTCYFATDPPDEPLLLQRPITG